MSELVPLWARVLLIAAVVGILIANILVRPKCKKCGAVLREVSAADPLTWHSFTIKRIPRFRTVRYRCDKCGSESTVKELTSGQAQ
jgi:hypothetical protein